MANQIQEMIESFNAHDLGSGFGELGGGCKGVGFDFGPKFGPHPQDTRYEVMVTGKFDPFNGADYDDDRGLDGFTACLRVRTDDGEYDDVTNENPIVLYQTTGSAVPRSYIEEMEADGRVIGSLIQIDLEAERKACVAAVLAAVDSVRHGDHIGRHVVDPQPWGPAGHYWVESFDGFMVCEVCGEVGGRWG